MWCICKNQQFQSRVTSCVTLNCPVIDALGIYNPTPSPPAKPPANNLFPATKNTSLTNCDAPTRDHGPGYIVLSYTMIILAAIFVLTRFAFKIASRNDLGLDDWFVLLTLLGGIGCHTATVLAVNQGLGRDLWTLRPAQITNMLRFFEILAVLYFATLTLLKLSMIFFYLKVFTTTSAARLLWGTAAFTSVWGLVYVVVAIFQCRPISYFWTQWDGQHSGKCLNIAAITSSNAGISIALDLWSLGIPLWQLWGLNMHYKKKIGVALMFGVGTFVTVVSILRLQALVNFAKSTNVSWNFLEVSRWSTIEIGVGTICICLPTMRQLFVALFPALDVSKRSHQHYRKYGTSRELNDMSKGKKIRGLGSGGNASILSGGSKMTHTEERGSIVVKSSFTVGGRSCGDTDEISLVEKSISNS
ncbi:hypothetical protein E8E13_000882 [Curvularia kusanoi]|uniref:Rhodopsin domain-containing protein n=1 Tax=Curvularia kusanoi TaxID=90978 RepID=A0A9P4T4V0_CURKU|nr:hypothetical protein E8E13_000882 [Curvularia kusanoi]